MERLPTSHLLLLTPSLFLHPLQTLLFPPLGLLRLLVASALVEVLHHHTHKHVEHKKRHNQQEGDEVQKHPGIVVHHGLKHKQKHTEKEEGNVTSIIYKSNSGPGELLHLLVFVFALVSANN